MQEAERVLKPSGVFRVVVPDLALFVEDYIKSGDADAFCTRIHMSYRDKPTFAEKISLILFGNRRHKWMYDGSSIKNYIQQHSNFNDIVILKAGETTIKGEPLINLYEHDGESVYVECRIK